MPEPMLRPRSPTEAVDAALRLAIGHLGSYVAVTALITLPAIIFWAVEFEAVTTPQAIIADRFRTFGVLGLLNLVLVTLASATVISAMSDVYLGRALRLGDAFRRGLSRAPMLIVAVVVRWVVVSIGFVFIFVPGVYAAFRTTCLDAVAVLEPERRGPFWIFGRTWSLAEEEVTHLMLTLLLALVIYVAGIAVSEVLVRLLGAAIPALNPLRMHKLIQAAMLLFVQPIFPATITVLYYDLRVRKEAFDLELMAGSLEAPAP